jgi:AcrR family transcriptional regulator
MGDGMTAKDDTVTRILDGTLLTLARRGVRKLSMSDVGTQAGISRGTLYRYFNSKEDLLAAIAGHVEKGLLDELVKAVDRRPDLEMRVQVVVESIVYFSRTHPEAIQVVAIEPGFGVEYVRRVFPEFVAVAEQLMAPALELTPTVQSGAMSSSELSELILRVASSTFFIPATDIDEIPRVIATLPCLQLA